MAVNLADALTAHDRVRRSTDIPFFYGRKEKDSITPQQLILRFETAAKVAGWATPKRKCEEFYLCLRDKALGWYNTLENIIGFNPEDWEAVKEQFLKAYAPRYTAKTLCTNFQDLKQKSDETVQDYYNRVSEVFRDAYKVKPNHVLTCPGDAGARFDLAQEDADTLRLAGIMAMQLLMMNTVFIGGLREEIRSKVLETSPTQIQESVDLARQFEVIAQDKKVKGTTISSIARSEGDEDEDEDELLEIINAVRARSGKPPYKFRPGGPGGARSGNKSGPQCFYCKNMGHIQRDCRKRLAANAPLAKPPKVNSVKKDGKEDDSDDAADDRWGALNY